MKKLVKKEVRSNSYYYLNLGGFKDINEIWSILFSCASQYPTHQINLEAIKKENKNGPNK